MCFISDLEWQTKINSLWRVNDYQKQHKIILFTELELCGLAINIVSFAHLLKRIDFDAMLDHLALTHIIQGKGETATNRIKRLLEVFKSYIHLTCTI